MADGEPKRSAFAVMLQSAAKKDRSPLPRKKQRVAGPNESSFERCPICGRSFGRAIMPSHVNGCIDSQKSESKVSQDQRDVGPAATDQVEPAKPLEKQQRQLPAQQSTQEGLADSLPSSRSTKTDQDGQGNAFTRLMQQQRNQSKIHNFYLLMRPDKTYTWHWWITEPGTDARMAAELLPGPQQGQKKAAEFSKGAVNPSVRHHFGGGPSTQRAGSDQSSAGEAPLDKSSIADKLKASSGELPRTTEIGGNAASSNEELPDSVQNETGSSDKEAWKGLPPAEWHALTNVSASKLGGAPRVKLSLRFMTNEPAGNAQDLGWKAGGLQSNTLPPGEKGYQGSNSVLKSALQKNVRLCRPEEAVRCALHLMKEDPSEFLRRCCIICVEDSILHPALPLLVWLMAAHAKGYAMTHSQASRCLAVVYHMSHSPVKDHLEKDSPKKAASCLQLFEDARGLPPEQAVLVRSLLCRAAYGGMTGDIELLKGFAQLWADRFSGQGEQPPTSPSDPEGNPSWHDYIWEVSKASHSSLQSPDSAYNVRCVGSMLRKDIPLSAVDFHVSSIIEEMVNVSEIAQKAKELKVDAAQQLRTGMWRFRSGLSNKSLLKPAKEREADAGEATLKEFWRVALPHVEQWSEAFLDKRFHFP